MPSTFFLAAMVFALLTVPTSAHVGVTLEYPNVPDPTSMTIDGADDDWGWFPGEYLLNQEDFFDRESRSVATSDFDFVIYTAWSPPPDNSWYLFARFHDDTLKVDNDNPLNWWKDDALQFTVDADHSGGSIFGFTREELVNGQRFYARSWPPAQQELLLHGQAGFLDQHHDPYLTEFQWITDSPFFEVAWTIDPPDAKHGSTGVTYTYEWKMAMWDVLGNSPEESIRHNFSVGDVVHIGYRPLDADRPGNGRKHSMYVLGGDMDQDKDGDEMPDFVAVETSLPSLVESSTWARIKWILEKQLR
jgi:hypothetical protein